MGRYTTCSGYLSQLDTHLVEYFTYNPLFLKDFEVGLALTP